MLQHALAIFGLGVLCGAWVLLQRWIARRDPMVKGPESGCTSCSCGDGQCRNRSA